MTVSSIMPGTRILRQSHLGSSRRPRRGEPNLTLSRYYASDSVSTSGFGDGLTVARQEASRPARWPRVPWRARDAKRDDNINDSIGIFMRMSMCLRSEEHTSELQSQSNLV